MIATRNNFSLFISNTLLLVLLIVLAVACKRHRPSGEEVMKSYETQKGVVTLKVPPGLIGIFISKDNPELKETLSEMESIKIMIVNRRKIEADNIRDFTIDFQEKLKSYGFEVMFEATDGEQRIKVLVLDNEEYIEEMMVLLSGQDEFLGLSMTGKIEPENLIEIAKGIEFGDFQIN